ncbi:hypothetical protein E4656_02245 [Natronospirillum operosum]|uniref:ParB/Sulfiredoxin domain-containing protein n=1 Tax=Natronospirillum operosum TaxID=2759953 RepID=A0A4Z0WAT7_9GAMM|nr:hypothetical protein [Natronospirillum operosum]TGG95262.1 hypothetical protein E4656_02245 [Natronospirillum operosum]
MLSVVRTGQPSSYVCHLLSTLKQVLLLRTVQTKAAMFVYTCWLVYQGNWMKTQKGEVADVRALSQRPVEAFQRADNVAALINIRTDLLRGFSFLGFPCASESCHPLVATAAHYHAGRSDRYEGSPLELYYNLVRPRSVAEILGLEGRFSQWRLNWLPPLFADVPWRRAPSFHVWRRNIKTMRRDAAQHGVRVTGRSWNFAGPTDAEVASLEWHRVCSLVDSIAEHGYDASKANDHIGGALLVRGKEYSLLVKGGQHRAAALAALGYEEIPVIIRQDAGVIRREEVDTWPAVRSGVLTRTQALQVFDRVFEGRHPRCVRPYCEALTSLFQ